MNVQIKELCADCDFVLREWRIKNSVFILWNYVFSDTFRNWICLFWGLWQVKCLEESVRSTLEKFLVYYSIPKKRTSHPFLLNVRWLVIESHLVFLFSCHQQNVSYFVLEVFSQLVFKEHDLFQKWYVITYIKD